MRDTIHDARRLIRLLPLAAILIVGVLLLGSKAALAASPTCSSTLGITVHGQHVVGDYVTGAGHENLAWPPKGSVGEAISGEGAVLPGGPGPTFHFANGFAPGASFCLTQSQSPGFHVP
ncbi:MAG: hypothetical protein M3P51_11640 [Chloroflexota bacterium]|nr:hypothetical protein [Chloroflexota bacterium]